MKTNRLKIIITGILLFEVFLSSAQKMENIALTPPMGWNSWNCFMDEGINEEKIKEIAEAMVSSGLKDAGYEYVVIDDGWATNSRDSNGHIVVDPVKFPNGIKPLADYIHGLGLKFGIYSAPGCFTCAGLMGSFGHEQIDANDYASWGIDFLKYDWCNYPKTRKEADETPEEECRAAFELMRDCLKKTGRPIVYSVNATCRNHSREGALPWVKSVAHMFRTSSDIKNDWKRMLYCLENTADLYEYAEPGYWNDPDMLEVGNNSKEYVWGELRNNCCQKMNLVECQSHFSMWCMLAAPLIAGNDLRNMENEIVEILTNRELIAVNQDSLGKQGRRIRDDGDLEVWVKELTKGRKAVALLNRSDQPATIKFNWEEIGLKGKVNVRDLWKHENLGKCKEFFIGENISPHATQVLLLEK